MREMHEQDTSGDVMVLTWRVLEDRKRGQSWRQSIDEKESNGTVTDYEYSGRHSLWPLHP